METNSLLKPEVAEAVEKSPKRAKLEVEEKESNEAKTGLAGLAQLRFVPLFLVEHRSYRHDKKGLKDNTIDISCYPTMKEAELHKKETMLNDIMEEITDEDKSCDLLWEFTAEYKELRKQFIDLGHEAYGYKYDELIDNYLTKYVNDPNFHVDNKYCEFMKGDEFIEQRKTVTIHHSCVRLNNQCA